MSQVFIGGIKVQFTNLISLFIYPKTSDKKKVNLVYDFHGSTFSVEERENISTLNDIQFNQDSNDIGLCNLQLIENIEYIWEVETKQYESKFKITSSLENQNRFWYSIKETIGTFKVTNFLGIAWIAIDDKKFKFEIIPEKFKSEEYKELTKEITDFCEQLLLDWNSPTAHNFIPDEKEKNKIVLEQFLFLRDRLSQEKFEFYKEVILNNPHRKLEKEGEYKHIMYGSDRKFFQNPIRYGKGWIKTEKAPKSLKGRLPQFTYTERKFDSFDTPPNRFLKFAMEYFSSICDIILEATKDKITSAQIEAESIQHRLQEFLSSYLFDNVSNLHSLPLNNQSLLRKEGYRQILEIFLNVESASHLHWEGRDDAFSGENRSVDKLYEYWLFIKLYKLLGSLEIQNEKLIYKEKESTFIKKTESGLSINLKSGKDSMISFTHESLELNLDLYYNKKFNPYQVTNANNPLPIQDSYSRIFRPDFTIVIYPKKLSEKEAIQEGSVAYLHFDAKYRIDQIDKLFGAEELYNKNTSESDTNEIEEEKREQKATNVYKVGDLYKMHTYNEAIRKTVGSYILYPGDENKKFQKFHEILPGVGAFVMKPNLSDSKPDSGELEIFLKQIIEHQASRYTELYRLRYWEHKIINEHNYSEVQIHSYNRLSNSPPKDTYILFGYIRDEEIENIKITKKFYFHAIKNGQVIELDKNFHRATVFIGFKKDGNTLNWNSKIKNIGLVTKEIIDTIKVDTSTSSPDKSHYYLLDLEEPAPSTIDSTVHKRLIPGKPIVMNWTEFVGNPGLI